MSSHNLDDCEYLTGTVEKARFGFYALGKLFNKGLDKDKDKKEGLLKRLKNIEDKNEKLLEVKK